MISSIDVTKIPGYVAPIVTDQKTIPVRHACGNILYADLTSEYPVFYGKHSISPYPYENLLIGARPLKKCPACSYPLNMDWMRNLYLVEPMDYYLAILTVGRRVCSHCWGQLISTRYGSKEIVLCHQCTYDTIGYVTHRFVDSARASDLETYETCAEGLRQALELDPEPVREKRPNSALMTELGF